MNCEFDYCIYNKNLICILTDISINKIGMCEECEIVPLPKNNLENYKHKRLQEIAKLYEER